MYNQIIKDFKMMLSFKKKIYITFLIMFFISVVSSTVFDFLKTSPIILSLFPLCIKTRRENLSTNFDKFLCIIIESTLVSCLFTVFNLLLSLLLYRNFMPSVLISIIKSIIICFASCIFCLRTPRKYKTNFIIIMIILIYISNTTV